MAKRKGAGPTYTATLSDGKVCYTHEPSGNLFGNLPFGARITKPGKDGDEWDGLEFALESGRTGKVVRDV
jgi:hypothetical protein